MKSNKSGELRFIYVIITFGVLAMMIMFSTIFIYQIGKEQILDEVLNATITAETQLNVSTALKNHANSLKNEYDNISLPYDLFFLFIWISSIVTSVTISLNARKKTFLSFSGSLFIGIMGLLLIVFFLDQFQVWFFENIFYAVLDDITLNLPIMTYYFNNIGWISAIWFVALLFLNQVEFELNLRGRLEE